MDEGKLGAPESADADVKGGMTTLAWVRRAIVAVIGFTVLAVGVAMIVLPGPAIVVIPLGLAILATEFVWAKRWLDRAKATFARKERTKEEKKSKREQKKIEG